jgi:heme/copper-type cytochrome/quinol oxidase subunit 2
MKILYPLGMIAAALFSLYSCYGALFWGWITATPLTDSQRERAQYNTYAWFAIFASCWLVVFVLLFCWLRSSRKPESSRESSLDEK